MIAGQALVHRHGLLERLGRLGLSPDFARNVTEAVPGLRRVGADRLVRAAVAEEVGDSIAGPRPATPCVAAGRPGTSSSSLGVTVVKYWSTAARGLAEVGLGLPPGGGRSRLTSVTRAPPLEQVRIDRLGIKH